MNTVIFIRLKAKKPKTRYRFTLLKLPWPKSNKPMIRNATSIYIFLNCQFINLNILQIVHTKIYSSSLGMLTLYNQANDFGRIKMHCVHSQLSKSKSYLDEFHFESQWIEITPIPKNILGALCKENLLDLFILEK